MDVNRVIMIDPSSKSLKFLSKRILLNNYRGIQISQHNRYTYDQVIGMLRIMFNLVGHSKMQIRTTDLSKRPNNISGEEIYAEYTREVNQVYGKSTQDSIRKNLFVDFHRMGLIDRFSPKGEKLLPYERKPVKFVKLTELGLQIIRTGLSELQQYMLFTRAIDTLLSGFASDILDIMLEIDTLSINEMQYFVSFLYQDFYGQIVMKEEIIQLIRDYRTLSRYQRHSLDEVLKELCDPKKFFGDKTSKRDYHNWINESQQIFMILGMTAYYEYNSYNRTIKIRVDENSLFEDVSKLKRSTTEKYKYFDNHNVEKSPGFELHHIVPLSWARSKEEFYILDKWENLIYIDGFTHAKITQNGNRNVILNIIRDTYDIEFEDFDSYLIYCQYDTNAKYNIDLSQKMLDKNSMLLQS
jgi:hypothetical protein